jgi:putative endonuclease
VTRLRQQLGKSGEDIALDFLQQKGMRLCARNYRVRSGEIDLIMWDGEILVFVEVRTKSASFFGKPSETVLFDKRRKITGTARHFLAQHRIGDEVRCRFDMVGIVAKPGVAVEIEHVVNAFFVGE